MAGGTRYFLVNGQGKVLSNLNAQVRRMKTNSEIAVKAGALVVLKQALIWTPVDTRNLIGSGDVRTGKNSDGTAFAEIFYTAEYAAAVHEMDQVLAKEGYRAPVFQKPGARAHFLADALVEKRREALDVIAKIMRVAA